MVPPGKREGGRPKRGYVDEIKEDNNNMMMATDVRENDVLKSSWRQRICCGNPLLNKLKEEEEEGGGKEDYVCSE